jgi:multiple sugar transport system substrate-binding protein
MSGHQGMKLRKSVGKPGGSLITRRGFLAGLAGATASTLAIEPLVRRPLARAAAPLTLRYVDWQLAEEPTGTAYRAVIADFEKSHPNIKVQAEPIPLSQYPTRIVTQAKAGQAPDVIRIFDPWLRGWIREGFLLNLNPLVEKVGGRGYTNLFYAPTVELATVQAALYGIPGWNGALMLQYNAKMFEEAGLDPAKPPRTWADLLAYAKKLTKPGGSQYGIAIQGAKQSSAVTRFVTWLFNNDVDIITKSGDVDLDSPRAIEALTFWTELATKQKVTPPGVTDIDVQNARSLYAQRKVAMFQNASNAAYLVAADNPSIRPEIRMAPMPTNVAKAYTPQFMSFLSIAANSPQKDAAWELVQAFNTKESWIQIWRTSGMLPARKDALEDPELQKDPVARATAMMANNVKFIPPIPEWPQISDALGDAMQKVLSNQKTPEAAMKEAAQATRTILKKA